MDETEDKNDVLRFIATTVGTMRDQMATKSELHRLEEKMEAGFIAVRGDIERVSLRLDTIERALSTRLSLIETEVSRLRSVLYLLVKDQPELLRLLGTEPPLVQRLGRLSGFPDRRKQWCH